MRRWGTCSWPGRCWKWLKSFTKGNGSPGNDDLQLLAPDGVSAPLRKEAQDDQLMAAQAHLKLGEVSVESGTDSAKRVPGVRIPNAGVLNNCRRSLCSGNYSQALDDFQECLRLQVEHLDADSRLLAETHYQLGLTYGLDLQHSRAIAELNRSISVIKSRLGEDARNAAAAFRHLSSVSSTCVNCPDRQAAGAGGRGRGPGRPGG